MLTFKSSSSSLACPVIWGRRYSWSMILFLHATLFVVLSSFRPTCVMSLLHASFHRRFGCPLLLLFPGMSNLTFKILTMCSSFILLTWPYHFSRFSVIFLDACTFKSLSSFCSVSPILALLLFHNYLKTLK